MRREFTLTGKDGVSLIARAWIAQQPRAALCVIHGLGEHGDRYAGMASKLNAAGISVYSHDQRGHGRNPGKRGVARIKDMEQDALCLIEYAQRDSGLPTFLFGHSLGGCVGLYTTLHAKPDVRASIITSPWLQLVNPPPAFLLSLVASTVGLWKGIHIHNGIGSGALCHDAGICAAYDADPYTHGYIGLALAVDATRAAAWMLEHPNELSVPLLLCHGSQDPICSVEGSRRFAQGAGEKCGFVEYPGMYHELHNEPQAREQLFTREIEFIQQHL